MTRYSGPARIRIHGDQNAGSVYVGLARTLLGEQMAIHVGAYDTSRVDAGAPKPTDQIRRTVNLPNGVKITVQYNNFIPIIDIWTSPVSESIEEPEFEGGYIVWPRSDVNPFGVGDPVEAYIEKVPALENTLLEAGPVSWIGRDGTILTYDHGGSSRYAMSLERSYSGKPDIFYRGVRIKTGVEKVRGVTHAFGHIVIAVEVQNQPHRLRFRKTPSPLAYIDELLKPNKYTPLEPIDPVWTTISTWEGIPNVFQLSGCYFNPDGVEAQMVTGIISASTGKATTRRYTITLNEELDAVSVVLEESYSTLYSWSQWTAPVGWTGSSACGDICLWDTVTNGFTTTYSRSLAVDDAPMILAADYSYEGELRVYKIQRYGDGYTHQVQVKRYQDAVINDDIGCVNNGDGTKDCSGTGTYNRYIDSSFQGNTGVRAYVNNDLLYDSYVELGGEEYYIGNYTRNTVWSNLPLDADPKNYPNGWWIGSLDPNEYEGGYSAFVNQTFVSIRDMDLRYNMVLGTRTQISDTYTASAWGSSYFPENSLPTSTYDNIPQSPGSNRTRLSTNELFLSRNNIDLFTSMATSSTNQTISRIMYPTTFASVDPYNFPFNNTGVRVACRGPNSIVMSDHLGNLVPTGYVNYINLQGNIVGSSEMFPTLGGEFRFRKYPIRVL